MVLDLFVPVVYALATVAFNPGAGIFVSKLRGNGVGPPLVNLTMPGSIVWTRQMEGNGAASGVAVDGSGNVYTAGRFEGTIDFDPSGGTFNLTSDGGLDIFVTFGGAGPVTSNVWTDPNPVNINSITTLRATMDDTNTGRSNIASAGYEIRDTTGTGIHTSDMIAADGFYNQVTENVYAQITGGTFEGADVYDVCVWGTDVAGYVGYPECVFLPVYDPDGGFVTGGGWIYSAPGSCSLTDACESVEGKVNFGFVSEYKKGANTPTGNTEFNFKAGNLNFHSDSYDTLVVAGPRAMYSGTGTINGGGGYSFLLTAIDGAINGGKTDKFRIMIWGDNGLVYDNNRGEDPIIGDATELGGGNITNTGGIRLRDRMSLLCRLLSVWSWHLPYA